MRLLSSLPGWAQRALPALHRLLGAAASQGWFFVVVAGCATWQAPVDVGDAPLRARAVTASERDVRVTAAVLSAEDSRRMFGADVNTTRVQPIWVEVENRTSERLWLLRSGTDPDFFSPLEVAWSVHAPLAGATNARIDGHFDSLGFKNPVPPGATHAGILFTNPDRGTKLLNIDLLEKKALVPFSLLLPVPDDAADPRFAQALYRYPDSEITDYEDLTALRAAFQRLPCCATDAHGATPGDPLNALFVGRLADIGAALVRRNYRRDLRQADFAQRVFDRRPDAILRKQAQAGAPATTLRAWLAPVRFRGQDVYLVQAGRPVGGRFAPRDADVVLHEDVDEVRNLLIQDMMYSGGLDKLGFVTGVGRASRTAPRTTLGGARYHTDGVRAVLFFATRPLSLSDVEMLDWEPHLERREAAAHGENDDARR